MEVKNGFEEFGVGSKLRIHLNISGGTDLDPFQDSKKWCLKIQASYTVYKDFEKKEAEMEVKNGFEKFGVGSKLCLHFNIVGETDIDPFQDSKKWCSKIQA